MKELKNSLKQLKNLEQAGKPSTDFVSKNREILLMQIKNSSSAGKKKLSPLYAWRAFASVLPENLFNYAIKPIMAMLLVFAIGFGGWTATVSASYNSLPGDTLYPVKLLVEKAQLTLTSKADEVSLRTEFAARRLEEMRKILEAPYSDDKEEKTKTAVKNFKEQVKAVQTTLETLDSKDEKTIEAAKIIDSKTKEYTSALEKAGESPNEETKREVDEANNAVEDAGIKAIEVIVKSGQDTEIELNEEVVSKVEEKIKIVEDKAGVLDEDGTTELSEDVIDALDEAKQALDDNDLETVVDKIVEAKNLVNTAVGTDEIASSTLKTESEEIEMDNNSTSTNLE